MVITTFNRAGVLIVAQLLWQGAIVFAVSFEELLYDKQGVLRARSSRIPKAYIKVTLYYTVYYAAAYASDVTVSYLLYSNETWYSFTGTMIK